VDPPAPNGNISRPAFDGYASAACAAFTHNHSAAINVQQYFDVRTAFIVRLLVDIRETS
jgi:hypothetical protein